MNARDLLEAFFDSIPRDVREERLDVFRQLGRFVVEQKCVLPNVHHWITLHETGNVAGFTPILVMDVWEHAFLLDYKPAERPKYIEAFFSNIAWNMVEDRLKKLTGVQTARA